MGASSADRSAAVASSAPASAEIATAPILIHYGGSRSRGEKGKNMKMRPTIQS